MSKQATLPSANRLMLTGAKGDANQALAPTSFWGEEPPTVDVRSAARRLSRRIPRPFLKWVGGKGQLLEALLGEIERAGTFSTYHEPFVGGGAVFFELSRQSRLPGRARLSDTNFGLIETYRGVREEVDAVIALLAEHAELHSKHHYYSERDRAPADTPQRAARIIYLNKTCFNGLYRENRSGKFNVPMGTYDNPTILDENNLRAASLALKAADIRQAGFESVLDGAQAGDLVYFDPPYHPVSTTSSFTSYSRDGFGPREQKALHDTTCELTRKNVKVILSNSSTEFVASLYEGFRKTEIFATRAVNSNSERRGKVPELIIANF